MEKTNDNKHAIVLIDDEYAALRAMDLALCVDGFCHVQMFTSWSAATKKINPLQTSAILLDLIMPDVSGIDALKECLCYYPWIPVIIVTGVNDVESAVTCMKLGAVDYLTKPLNNNRFVNCVRNVLFADSLQNNKTSIVVKPDKDEGTSHLTVTEKITALESLLGKIVSVKNNPMTIKHRMMLNQFVTIMKDRKAYIDPDINMSSVAKQMNSNTTYLRIFLRNVFQCSFSQYVNTLRILDFIVNARKNQGLLSIEGICRMVGFTRRATFYDVFKSITGMAQGEYITGLKNNEHC